MPDYNILVYFDVIFTVVYLTSTPHPLKKKCRQFFWRHKHDSCWHYINLTYCTWNVHPMYGFRFDAAVPGMTWTSVSDVVIFYLGGGGGGGKVSVAHEWDERWKIRLLVDLREFSFCVCVLDTLPSRYLVQWMHSNKLKLNKDNYLLSAHVSVHNQGWSPLTLEMKLAPVILRGTLA